MPFLWSQQKKELYNYLHFQKKKKKNSVNLENELQGKIEQLKHDMEGQFERYKSELEDESGKLKKENEKLREELQNVYKEQEVAIQTGRPAGNSEQTNTTTAMDEAPSVQDHSALFNLPDIDTDCIVRNADASIQPHS